MSGFDDAQDVLTVRQASGLLNVPRSSLYALISAGEIPAVRIGERRVRIIKGQLLDWLSQQAVKM